MAPSWGKWDNACEGLLQTENVIYNYSYYHHHLVFWGPNSLCLPSWHLTKLSNDSVLTKAVTGANRYSTFCLSLLPAIIRLCSPALANTWRYHIGERQECVCFYARLKQGGDVRLPTHHIPSWQPRACTQHRAIQGINEPGRAKNNFFFWRGQFSWYYPHKKFQKSLQILPSPTVISFGRREYFFIVQCSLFGSWGLPTCCFQHLPFKGRRKTDGHKNISEAKYTMQNDSYCKKWRKNAGRLGAGVGSGGCRPLGKV